MTIVKDGCEALTITQNGYGKRTDISEYRRQGRAGGGVKVGALNDKTGGVVNLKLVDPENDDVIIISDNGVIIRVRAGEISKMSRNTQGVKVMRIKDGNSKVVAFTVVPHSEEESEDLADAPQTEATDTAEGVAETTEE